MTLISGPTGAGKTALAVMFVWNLAMKPEFQCKGRSCNKKGCKVKWTIYTNSKRLTGTSWERDGESVVHDIDEILPMIQAKKKIDHAIFFVDECQEWIDNRSSMSKGNKEVSYLIAQMRKMTCKTYMTTPSINNIDRRVRDAAKRTFTVWNPDEKAVSVHALIRQLNVGNLAPWERDRLRDDYRVFFTAPYKHMYDTHEQLDPPKFFDVTDKINIVRVTEVETTIDELSYADIIKKVIRIFLLLGLMKVGNDQMLAQLKQDFGIDWDLGRLSMVLRTLNYAQDESGMYKIGITP